MSTISQTTDFESLQYTAVYQHDNIKSEEVNKLLLGFGLGKNFICADFDIEIKVVEKATPYVFAILKPGIFVQDTTLINFKDVMGEEDTINIQLYNETTKPGPGTLIYVGCQYYHGTQGDGINASPTYAKIVETNSLTYYTNFIPWYRIEILDDYGGVRDLTHMKIERVIPHLKYDGPGAPVSYLKYYQDENLKVYGTSSTDDSLIWALVFGK